jgi:hypothetical protein
MRPSGICPELYFWLFEGSTSRVPAALTYTHSCDTLCVCPSKLPWESMSRWEPSCAISARRK